MLWNLAVLMSYIRICKHVRVFTVNDVKFREILRSLDSTKATGVDGVPARILKVCADELSIPLTLIYNLSFSLGEVPLLWKKPNITPVFKNNDKGLVENCSSCYLFPRITLSQRLETRFC